MTSLLTLVSLALPLAVQGWGIPQGSQRDGGPPSSLSQHQTNGGSELGSFSWNGLPPYADGPFPGGSAYPWGNRNVSNTNPYVNSDAPNTGVVRYYDWTVTNTTLAPDGVELPLLVVNGAFPGPLIEANWGDWIEVKVTNGLVTEGTSIHWHGFLQQGTPWMDGTPGISQCPIAPGSSFTYRFQAQLYGTTWWHGHYSSQYVNGMSGPIVVHGPASDNDYDIDIGPVMLTDWFHDYYTNLLIDIFYATPTGVPHFPPMSNNMLINGKNNYNCSLTKKTCHSNAGLANFKFQTGKKHRLRLINHSAEAVLFFSIDGYNFTVIANDFVPVNPYTADVVTLAVGQRMDIIVTGGSNPEESVWMRMTEGPSGIGPDGATGCSLNDGNAYEVVAGIYYEEADTSKAPTTTSKIPPSTYLFPFACSNPLVNGSTPSYVIPVATPEVTMNLLMTGNYNETGAFVWYINNVTFYADYNDPVLLEAKLGNTTFPAQQQTFNLGTAKSLRIIMTSVGFPASHPMHIHGHNMQVLAEGLGQWDNVTITNPGNPQRRDTQLIRPNGYLVIQLDLDNPGVWPLHCHVAWHASEGMNINFLEQQPSVVNDMALPYVMAQTCRDWSAWTGNHVVPQIDSGL